MRKLSRVNVRESINGPIVRVINLDTLDDSAYTLACSLTRINELDLTVLFGAQGKAGQILAGYHKGGWFCGHGNFPVFRCTNPLIRFDSPTYPFYVDIHDKIQGPVIRRILGINPFRSAYDLACKLIHALERDLTVLSNPFPKLGKRVQAELSQNASLPLNAYCRSGYVLTGRHMEGWYCGQGNYPVYLQTPHEKEDPDPPEKP